MDPQAYIQEFGGWIGLVVFVGVGFFGLLRDRQKLLNDKRRIEAEKDAEIAKLQAKTQSVVAERDGEIDLTYARSFSSLIDQQAKVFNQFGEVLNKISSRLDEGAGVGATTLQAVREIAAGQTSIAQALEPLAAIHQRLNSVSQQIQELYQFALNAEGNIIQAIRTRRDTQTQPVVKVEHLNGTNERTD